MNCTRVLHILNPRPMPSPIMPVDVAMRICLAHSPPLRSFLGPYESCKSRNLVKSFKPLRPCISSKAKVDPSSRGWKSPKGKGKKRVVFADSKGMALTAIYVFKEFEDDAHSHAAALPPDLQFEMSDLEDAIINLKVEKDQSFVLDFPQPAADYLDFRNRLKTNLVCLESCVIQDRSLMGTVKVGNVSFEKSVCVRVTFDSWKSHADVPCAYMNNIYGCADVDTFSFALDLPGSVARDDRVEFCVLYSARDQAYWDNNDGKNYRLARADKDRSERGGEKRAGKKPEMEFDQFGSPRTSSGFFPEWQSWGRIENHSPYW